MSVITRHPLLLLLAVLFAIPLATSPSAGQETGTDQPGDPIPMLQDPAIPLNPAYHPSSDSEYLIGIEDILSISVWRDPDLTREVPVRPDGKISLPLIRDVMAAGKTPLALAEQIEIRLKEFLTSPSVTVIVKEVNSLKVYLLGEVAIPGPIMLRSNLRLLQAISMAGGVTEFGGRSGVLIYRQTPLREQVIEISYRDLLKGTNPSDNIVLKPNDTVVVR